MSADEQRAIVEEFQALREEEKPGVSAPRSCSRPRPRPPCASQEGKTLTTDGPFADTKEVVGGFWLLEADNLDAALELAAQDPGGAVGWRGRGAAAGREIALLEQVFRDEWGRVLANLIGFLGDFDLAEEAAQEAFAIAAERGRATGSRNPGAWLTTTARNRAIDRLRRDAPSPPRQAARGARSSGRRRRWTSTTFPDERLELIFTCCHPALALEAQVALTLRTLGGLTHRGDRARVPRPRGDDEAAALAREGQDQRRPASRSAFRRPPAPGAARAVLAVVYLIFNEGYGGRVDLAAEAIRLGRCSPR